MGSNLLFLKFFNIFGAARLRTWVATPKTIFLANKKPIHNTRFKTHPILIPVFGVSMGWLGAPGPSWASIWGLGAARRRLRGHPQGCPRKACGHTNARGCSYWESPLWIWADSYTFILVGGGSGGSFFMILYKNI